MTSCPVEAEVLHAEITEYIDLNFESMRMLLVCFCFNLRPFFAGVQTM